MPTWMESLFAVLALPEYGLSSLFVAAFISATLLPVGSEPALFGLLKLNPDLFWSAIAVATAGNTLGGMLDWWMGYEAHQVVDKYRHSRTHVVTAAMDHIDFIQPVHVGDLLILKSSVNRAFNTSVEVGVKVWVEHPQTGVLLHVASAYLVFVAVDREGRRQKVPQLLPETPNEIRRFADLSDSEPGTRPASL